MTTAVLAGCSPPPQVQADPPLPTLPTAQNRASQRPEGPSLAPLATPQQVVRAVDVGRRDPFAAVLSPRLISAPPPQRVGPKGVGSKPPQPLVWPKGLDFQGVLQGPLGAEALVEYVPVEAKGVGSRSGSLRVGDVGTGQEDSLLPPGWRVRAIDVDRGVLVLQAGDQSVTRPL